MAEKSARHVCVLVLVRHRVRAESCVCLRGWAAGTGGGGNAFCGIAPPCKTLDYTPHRTGWRLIDIRFCCGSFP